MKGKILIGFMLLAFIFISFASLQAQQKYYILFDNFEDQMVGNTQITNLIDLCYWDPMKDDVIFGKYTERAPFSAATFNKRAITEYDVAVFPMGVELGLDHSVDGIKVIDKIYEMLNAGKTVLIIGNAVVLKGFTGSDAKVKEFLSNYLGIEYPLSNEYIQQGRVMFFDGTNIWGAMIDGVEGDPVAKGFDKVINQGYNLNNGGFRYPIRYPFYLNIDVMGLKSNSTSVGFDFVSVVRDDSVDVTKNRMWTGIRNEKGTARVALWTTNYDIANTWHTLYYNEALMGAFEWGTRDIPRPEKYILTENMQVNFGKVEPGSKSFKAIAFQNFGRTPLSVTKMEIAELEDPGVFKIIEGGDAVKLDPLEIHTINLQFAPNNTVTFNDGLDIFSDATNGTLSLELYGVGGENTETGPKISVSQTPIDFGSVNYGQYMEKNIAVSNIGDTGLDIYEIDMVNSANKFFSFPKTINLPVVIKPGETWYFQVRFTPLDTNGGSYNGEVTLRSSSLGNVITSVYFKAKGNPKNSSSGISLSSTELDYGKVKVGDSSIIDLRITNTGSTDLMFPVKPSFVGGGEVKAQYSFADGSEVIPTLTQGQHHDLRIKFKPQAAKLYPIVVKITSNDPTNGIINVPISGEGDPNTSVEDNPLSSVLSLQVNPNVNNGNAVFAYDYTGGLDKNINVKIIDMTGKTRMELYNGKAINGMHFINMSNLSLENGKYFIVTEMDGSNKMISFIVQK